MDKDFATILAALVGAVVGSLGAAYLRHRLEGKDARARKRDRVLQSYLLQLHDALESLWFRLENLSRRGGKDAMRDEDYGKMTTVYAWARALAYSRILLLDGIYPQVDHRVASALTSGFREINRVIKLQTLQHYDRIGLAEAVMVSERGRLRPVTFVEFRRQGDGILKSWPFEPAADELSRLPRDVLDSVLIELTKMLREINKETGVPIANEIK